MIEVKRSPVLTWLAPAFLVGLVGIFLVAPVSLKNKLDAVCYGI